MTYSLSQSAEKNYEQLLRHSWIQSTNYSQYTFLYNFQWLQWSNNAAVRNNPHFHLLLIITILFTGSYNSTTINKTAIDPFTNQACGGLSHTGDHSSGGPYKSKASNNNNFHNNNNTRII